VISCESSFFEMEVGGSNRHCTEASSESPRTADISDIADQQE